MYDISVDEATFDQQNTVIKINEKKPNLEITLNDCNFEVSFKYHILTNPKLLDDKGTVKGKLNGLKLIIKASPQVYNNFFQFQFDDIEIDVDDFGVEMDGGDLSGIVDYFSDTLKSFIKEYLLGQMNEQTKIALQGLINDLLLRVPKQYAFDDGRVDVDYSLVNDGIVITDDFLSVVMDGTVHMVD